MPSPATLVQRRRLARLTAPGLVLAAALGAAHAGPIPFDSYLQFSFDGVGAVIGCDPADPAGNFCSASSGTPTTFLDAPAWTFAAAAGGATLMVLDAFASGDAFDVFDFGVLIGSTSLPAGPPVDCGDDPAVCLATAGMSQGVFALGPGAHSLTLATNLSLGLGSGYLRVAGAAAAVPEPLSVALVLAALAALFAARRQERRPA